MSTPSATLIEVRDYGSSPDLFRRRSSELADWDDLVEFTFNAFNRDERYFRMHLHFSRETQCEEDELLTKEEWNDGVYFTGANRRFFAHFVTRTRGEPRGYCKRREPSPTPAPDSPFPSPEPRSPWTQPPLGTFNEQGVLQPFSPPTYDISAVSGPTSARRPATRPGGGPRRGRGRGRGRGRAQQPTRQPIPRPVPPPAQPIPAVRRRTSQRQNNNSTNVYTIGPPIPAVRYPNSRYFSSPFTFIPLQPAPPRPRTHAQQYRAPLPSSDAPVSRPAAATSAPAVTLRAPVAPMLPPRPAVRQPAGRSPARQPTTGSTSHQPIEISSASSSSSGDSSMDVDSDQHPGSHQPTTPLPPPPQNEDDNMDLYADPRFDSDYNACPSSSSASDAQNTPLPPPTFDEYEALQYPVVRSSPQQQYEGQTDDEEEDLTLQSALYPGSEFEQPPDDRVEDEQMSVAPTSPGSGGLFVRDENEMGNFEAALAWEDDGGEQSEMKRDEDEQEQERLDEDEQSSVAPSSAIPPSASTGGLFVSDVSETRRFAKALEWEKEDDADDDN